MPAKIITLSQKDQDLLRVAFDFAFDGLRTNEGINSEWGVKMWARVKDLKERLL